MVKRSTNFIIISGLILLLSGCGFQLQGNYKVPDELKQLKLTSRDKYSALTQVLQDRLRLNGITLVDDGDNYPVLNLANDQLERSTLSLYSTGNVAEYELNYQVEFTVTFPGEDPRQFRVNIRREYLDDPRTALAKSRESELLLKEMRIQASDKIIQTLATIDESN